MRHVYKIIIITITILTIGGLAMGKSIRSDVVEPMKRFRLMKVKGVPHEINYQGWLGTADDTTGVTGTFTMVFKIYDAETDGNNLWSETHEVQVSHGVFNVILGSSNPIPAEIFTGAPLWLEVQVGDEVLAPRKKLVSVGYAIQAENAEYAKYADTAEFAIYVDTAATDNDWVLETSPANYLRTYGYYGIARKGAVLYGNYAHMHVNLGVACTTGTDGINRYYCTVSGGGYNTASGSYATVSGGGHNTASNWYATAGGGWSNTASGSGATVGGGLYNTASGWYATVGGGYRDTASGYAATVGGGYDNTASDSAATVGGGKYNIASGKYATVSGGKYNTASGNHATIGGGRHNTASTTYATVGGGYSNTASGYAATVSGGYGNTADTSYATVGGGWGNTASGEYATVGGGRDNTGGWYATVGGGYYNTANGEWATVGGGLSNTASGYIATVGGGYYNTASGDYAAVIGGYADTAAGDHSIAGGYHSVVPSGCYNSVAFNGQTATASSQLRCGNISKTGGGFTIDHPLDPDNKILNHYFVESPEMVLIYRGVAVIGADGRATVHLPEYFDALNRNPMIQLTGVGTSDVYVVEEVHNDRFVIGGKPGTKVYWMVTGERKDQSAEIIRAMMPVEQPKTGALVGRSLDDEFLATTMKQLEEMGISYKFHFRTDAGRRRYELMKQPPKKPVEEIKEPHR